MLAYVFFNGKHHPVATVAGSRGWCGPHTEGARTRPLDAFEATQPSPGRKGALFSLTPDATRSSVGSPGGQSPFWASDTIMLLKLDQPSQEKMPSDFDMRPHTLTL